MYLPAHTHTMGKSGKKIKGEKSGNAKVAKGGKIKKIPPVSQRRPKT